YDNQGNYVYPDGFDSDTGDWKPGFESQREEWERQYAEAQVRFEAHKKQMSEAQKADQEAALETGDTPSSYSSETDAEEAPEEEVGGSLATDEALAALREKLTGAG